MKAEERIRSLTEKSDTYGSLPFWSWNDKLDPEELRRQIRVMNGIGMHGFFMHARGGLETEYLSKEWFDCIRASIDEAKKCGMEAWAYDENGWPSGFVGGKLLENPANYICGLKMDKTYAYPEGEENNENLLGVYVREGTGIRRVTASVGDGIRYYIIRVVPSDSYVDTLDRSITEEFLKQTHEVYKKQIESADFGTVMPGFFTDEPQYYRYMTPWSRTLPEAFRKRYGRDIFEELPALFTEFDGAREFRYDFYLLIHTLFIENWIRPVYEWCDRNHVQLTGHAIEETSLAGQMMCCGGCMPFYEYEHIPGVDYLGRGLQNDLPTKQLGSVCAQLGKKKAISEMYAATGWGTTPRELKRIADLQYANGVNVMCQHLYSYSERGQRKFDYPIHFSEHMSWQSYMKDFNRHYSTLGYALSRGEESVNTLLIHPIRSAYLEYMRSHHERLQPLQDGLNRVMAQLSEHQIAYHFGDESMMARHASVENGKIRVGRCTYEYVVLPDITTLDGSTVELLRKFLAQGGKIWCAGTLPDRIDGRIADLSWLISNTDFNEIAAAAEARLTAEGPTDTLRMQIRHTEEGKTVYVTNRSDRVVGRVTLEIHDCRGLVEYDAIADRKKPLYGCRLPDGTLRVSLYFGDSTSYLLLESEDAEMLPGDCPEPETSVISLAGKKFVLDAFPENVILLDHAQRSGDGVNYTELQPIERIRDNLLSERYRGQLYMRFPFYVADLPKSLGLVAEPVRGMTLAVNGTPVTPGEDWRYDRQFHLAECADLVHTGENEITVSFPYAQRDYVYYVLYGDHSESLRNCLAFDTEISGVMLYGSFAVDCPGTWSVPERPDCICYDGEMRLVAQKAEIDPTDLVRDGYPFFSGSVRLRTTVTWKPGDPTRLVLKGRYAVCAVEVNGTQAGTLLFEDGISLDGLLVPGDNTIILTLYNAARNLVGPLHFWQEEPGTAPDFFSFEKMWEGNRSPVYRTRYAWNRFGIDLV